MTRPAGTTSHEPARVKVVTHSIGVDVGGTKLSAGVVDDDGNLVAEAKRESPARDTGAIVEVIGELVETLAVGRQIDAVGIAAAGFVDRNRQEVIYAPNLAWINEPLRDLVGARIGLPVVVENDANAAAWGEYEYGAGAGARSLLLVTIGTGVGGGIVLEGELMRGGFGGAAEVGHLRVVPDGRLCPCGNHGCWETYASGSALTRIARSGAAEEPAAARTLLDISAGDVEAITGPMVSTAAKRGDPVAVAAFAEIARWIGEGLASLTAVLDPDVIVVGGGVSESEDLSMAAIEAALISQLSGAGHRPAPALRRAKLGNNAGIIGVAALSRAT